MLELLHNKNRFEQSGRTLLEMIGVLALIGLLTIGGIMYYRRAIVQVHANDIMGNVYKRAVFHKEQSKFTQNMYEKQNLTAHNYGIRVGSPCGPTKLMISVGKINATDTPLRPDVCEEIFNRVAQETKLKAVYNECTKVEAEKV